MYRDLYKLICEDPKYKDELDKIWDENYDIIHKKQE
jgi:hypothetical protein